jgi:hypothetical protein
LIATLDVPTRIVRGGLSNVVSDAGLAATLELTPHTLVADVAAATMVAGDDNHVFWRRPGAVPAIPRRD